MVTTSTAPRPVRTVHAVLHGDYTGRWLDLRSNIELRTLDLLEDTKDLERLREALGQLIVRHNLVGFQGEPLEVDERASSLTTEEIYAILNAYYVALGERTALPKEPAAS